MMKQMHDKKAYIRQTRPPIFDNAGFCQQHEDFIHVIIQYYIMKIFEKIPYFSQWL